MLSGPNWNIINDLFAKCFTQVMDQSFCFKTDLIFWTQIIDAFFIFFKKELYTKPMTIEDVDISDMESICPDTPEEISVQITRNKYWWASHLTLLHSHYHMIKSRHGNERQREWSNCTGDGWHIRQRISKGARWLCIWVWCGHWRRKGTNTLLRCYVRSYCLIISDKKNEYKNGPGLVMPSSLYANSIRKVTNCWKRSVTLLLVQIWPTGRVNCSCRA